MGDRSNDITIHNDFYRLLLRRIALFSVVALVFLSSVFRFADILGIRLFLQIVFSIPVAFYFLYLFFQTPYKIFNVIIIYVIIKLIFELIWRANGAYIMENGLLIMALFIILSTRDKDLDKVVHDITWIATFFCALALIQWVVSFFFQDLVVNSMEFTESDQLVKGDNNIFSYFGFFSPKQYVLLGHTVARHQSFAKEPSLLLVFFYLSACITLLYNYKKYRVNFWIILLFSILSFSGSVMMAVAISIFFFVLLRFVNLKFIFPLGLLVLMLFYLTYIKNSGLDLILSFFLDLGSKNDLLGKTASISDRALPAVENWTSVLASPFGGRVLSDATGPWLVNSGLATGWVGIALLLFFLYGLGKQMRMLQVQQLLRDRIGISLILGSFFVFIIFNDYQMNSYSGLLLITLIQRVIIYRNEDFNKVQSVKSVVKV